ncbi:glucosidase [Prolixibacter sp. NT017]|uniref:MGH1-like glycoside hydrolase domain-containing protein n=1 Tax=Prolixibacter sp. NT017 TaxID=2652390 RepID=UPI0012727A7E|nr:glucosidase [Prolixibacter sp. NT017]GET24390.1 glucosidase [Prolixibacter sp. NT017]
MKNTEQIRLDEHYTGKKNWLKWGPYLSERQWGTVREDYSPDGSAWDFFPHDHARSRVYRWGEDGIAGITDEFSNLCFSVALWNGKDPIIKERLFGLTGSEGNHGEDVKELYYYLDSTPTHSYMKHLYKYPQAEFPYEELVRVNRNRSKDEGEYELMDTGIFNENRYFDVFTEYAKADNEDILIKITVHNRSTEEAELSVLPTLWFRNLWSFGLTDEKPRLELITEKDAKYIKAIHPKLGEYYFYFEENPRNLFTENETNAKRIFGLTNAHPFVKDAINDAVVNRNFDLFEGKTNGTKFSPVYELNISGGKSHEIKLRLSKSKLKEKALTENFDTLFSKRQNEADVFYNELCVEDTELKNIQRQAFAGMLWSKQYYNIDIPRWINGDPGQTPPPESRKKGRNHEWASLNNEDIISMPDKWEYPWYAAWDLAFHCIPLAMADPGFAKSQLILFLREWYMRPNGQLPAYEWKFSDVNPPVHAWACLQVYRIEKKNTGNSDVDFLKKAFQKLLINFTWWVNRKDHNDNNVFEGGFLGLDNIGVFDRSSFIPGGGHLEQADGTSWMAMYCLNMLDMALEIAQTDNTYEDVATKFFEHFVYIAESLNRMGEDWTGAWDEAEGFFYDILAKPDGTYIPLKVRSLVGLSSFFATLVLDRERLKNVPDFMKRLKWFRNYRIANNSYLAIEELNEGEDILLSLTPKKRLEKLLNALLDPAEFFSPHGIRSVSKIHEKPYSVAIDGAEYGLQYEPGEGRSDLFGGNSNWRGPVWMPMNYLLIQSLLELYKYYGNSVITACPADCDRLVNLDQVAKDISNGLISIFQPDADGNRPVHGNNPLYRENPHFKDLVLFYEYFHGDTGGGIGASHQTGWTGLVAELIDRVGKK